MSPRRKIPNWPHERVAETVKKDLQLPLHNTDEAGLEDYITTLAIQDSEFSVIWPRPLYDVTRTGSSDAIRLPVEGAVDIDAVEKAGGTPL